MNAAPTVGLLADALRYLAQREQRAVADYGSNDTTLHQRIQFSGGLARIDEATLDYLLSTGATGEIAARGSYLFLPAPQRGSIRIPVLNMIYDPEQTSFQLACFFMSPTADPRAVGYRYESPEQAGADGSPSMHGYHHCQPSNEIRSETAGSVRLPVAEPLIPDGEPALPLAASDPVDLLVCLLLSIYGRREAHSLIRESDNPELQRRLTTILGP